MKMNNIDIKYLITALADDEIKDTGSRTILLEKINTDKSLKFDYFVQQTMKSLVSGLKVHPVPERVRRKVIRRIKPFQFFSRNK